MTTDLRDALRSLHDEARRDAADLHTRPLVARARRRRTLVRTGYGAAGLGTAAAVAVGGVALSGRLGRTTPPPPAVTSTAPAPSPSATHAAEPSPTPSWTPTAAAPFQPDLAACGTTLDVPQKAALTFSTDEYAVADPGQPLTQVLDVGGIGHPGERATVAVLGAVLVASGEGTDPYGPVVGVAAGPLPGPAARVLGDPAYDVPDGTGHAMVSYEAPFVMCPGTDGAGGPPPQGLWSVWSQVQAVQDGAVRTAWGESSLQVGDVPPTPDPAPTSSALDPVILPEGTKRARTGDGMPVRTDQSSCSYDAATVTLAGSRPLAAEWTGTGGPITATATAWIENETLVVGLHLVNNGPALTNATVRYPTFYATSDAVNPPVIGAAGNVGVGWSNAYYPPAEPGTSMGPRAATWTTVSSWPAGGALDLELDAGLFTCTFAPGGGTKWAWMTASWPLYASTEVTVGGKTTPVRAPAITLTLAGARPTNP